MIAKRTSLTGNAVLDCSSDQNLKRRCAVVFYRRGPSQASLCDDGLGRRWAGAEERAGAQPQEGRGAVPRGPGGRSRLFSRPAGRRM